MFRSTTWTVLALVASACGADATTQATTTAPALAADAGTDTESAVAFGSQTVPPTAADAAACDDLAAALPPLAGATLGAAFATTYRTYDLGPVPGVPGGPWESLGAVYVRADEPLAMYVVAASETPKAALYRVAIVRDACGHILRFDGTAEKVASMPNADANLVASPLGWLYTRVPMAELGHAPIGDAPGSSDLKALGVPGPFTAKQPDPGVAATGIAVVPTYLAAAGELVISTYPSGDFFHVTTTAAAGRITATAVSKRSRLPHGPGGFAYVPPGSPGFTAPSLVVTEWYLADDWAPELNEPADGAPQGVAAYEVDDAGDPKPETRRPFFTQFPRPWGAFFEPVTGDFLFATWHGASPSPDRIVQVRGFAKPPPAPSPK